MLSQNSYFVNFIEKKQKKKFIFLLAMIFAFSLVQTAFLASIIPYVKIVQNAQVLFKATLAMFIFLTVKSIFHVYLNYITAKFPCDVFEAKTQELYNNYITLNYIDFIKKDPNKMIKNCTNTIQFVAIAHIIYLRALSSLCNILFFIGLLIVVSFKVSISLLVFFSSLGFIIYKLLRKHQAKAGFLREKYLGRFYTIISESIFSFKEIYLGSKYQYFQDRLQKCLAPLTKAAVIQSFFPTLPAVFLEYFFVVILMAVILFDSVLIPNLVFYIAVARLILSNFNNLIASRVQLKGAEASVKILLREEACKNINIIYDKKLLHSFNDKIELKDISFSYNKRTPILENVTLTLNKNEITAIVGPSGCGKTTLLEIIASLLKPDSGRILIDGKEVSDLSLLKSHIAYQSQHVKLLKNSIKANIAFGQEVIDDGKVMCAIKQAHLEEVIGRLNAGLDAQADTEGSNFSGGEKQRIGIARALYNDPDILLLDEASSHLDQVSKQHIIDAIKDLKGKKTIVIVAHDRRMVEFADKVYSLTSKHILL